MAISKKYSRRIVVDGVAYRWKIAPEPCYDQGSFGQLVVRVWRDDPPNSILYLIGGARPDNWHAAPGDIATPRRIAASVREALVAGWNPAAPGTIFRLVLSLADRT